jgi:hypothetical protein
MKECVDYVSTHFFLLKILNGGGYLQPFRNIKRYLFNFKYGSVFETRWKCRINYILFQKCWKKYILDIGLADQYFLLFKLVIVTLDHL